MSDGNKAQLMPLSTLRYSGEPPHPPPVPTTKLAHEEHAQFNEGIRHTGATPPPEEQQQQQAPATQEQPVAEKKKSGLFGKLAKTVKTVGSSLKETLDDVTVSAHRTVRDISKNSEQTAFTENFPSLSAQGAVLVSTHQCAALSGGTLMLGTLYISSMAVCFVGVKHRDAINMMDVASYLPSVSFAIDPKSPEGVRTAQLAAAQLSSVGTATCPTAAPSDEGSSSVNEDGEKVGVAPKSKIDISPAQLAPFVIGCPAPSIIPTALQIFTKSGQLYQFVDFTQTTLQSAANIGVKQTSCERACRYIDANWRKAMAAHNRVVVSSSVGVASAGTIGTEANKMIDLEYTIDPYASGATVGPKNAKVGDLQLADSRENFI